MMLTDNFKLKYEDSDKDKVSLENDDDLNLALSLGATLKVFIHGILLHDSRVYSYVHLHLSWTTVKSKGLESAEKSQRVGSNAMAMDEQMDASQAASLTATLLDIKEKVDGLLIVLQDIAKAQTPSSKRPPPLSKSELADFMPPEATVPGKPVVTTAPTAPAPKPKEEAPVKDMDSTPDNQSAAPPYIPGLPFYQHIPPAVASQAATGYAPPHPTSLYGAPPPVIYDQQQPARPYYYSGPHHPPSTYNYSTTGQQQPSYPARPPSRGQSAPQPQQPGQGYYPPNYQS